MAQQLTTYNIIVVFFVALGSFTYGFNASIMGTVLGLDSFYTYFDLGSIGSGTSSQSGIIGATNGLFSAGGVIGCCLVAWPADKIGRRRTVQVICIICVLSAALQTASVHIAMLLTGRLINGVGSGMMNVVVPLYQSEIAPRKTRGRLVGAHGFLIVSGYAVAGYTGLGCYFEKNPQIQWRLCLAIQMAAPLILALGSPRLPESPRWLLRNHRRTEALKVLGELHASTSDPNDAAAQEECNDIEHHLEEDVSNAKGLFDVLKNPSYRKRFLIGFFVQAVAQSTGVLVINNYQVLLYTGLGLTGYMPLLLYAIYATWAAFLNWSGSMIVDRAGRVRMLTIGCIGCALMVSCEAAMVAVYGGTSNKVGNGFGVFFLFAFVTFYGSCVDAISYVYCSEIFPTPLRALGMGFSTVALFLMTLIYTQAAPTAFAEVGWKYYLVFIFVPLLGSLVMFFNFPETKTLTLEEIGVLFGDTPVDPDQQYSHSIEGNRKISAELVAEEQREHSTDRSATQQTCSTRHCHHSKSWVAREIRNGVSVRSQSRSGRPDEVSAPLIHRAADKSKKTDSPKPKGRVQEPSQSQGSIRRREQNLLGKFSFRPPILPEHITASSTDTEQRPKRPQRQGLEAQRSHRKRTQDYMSALEDEVLRLRADRAKLSEIAENWKRCTAALVGARRQTSLDDHGAVRFELGSFLWLVSSPSSDGRSLPQMNEHLWPPWERHVPLSMSVLSQLGFREWEFTLLQNFCENIIPTLDLTERSVDGYAKHFMPLAFSNKMVMCSVLAASASHLQMAGAAKMAVGRLQYRSRAFASLQQAENQLAGDPLICLMALATIMGLLIDDMIGGNREHATLLKLADFWVSVKCPRGEKSDNRITHVFLKEQLQLLRTLVYPLYQFKMITSTESGASGASRSVGSFDSMGLCQMFSSLEKAMAQACQIYNFPPTANSSLHSHEMDQSSEALSTLLDQLVQTVRNIPPYALGENSLAWVYYVAASRSTQMDHSAFFTSRLVDLLHRMGYNDVKESVAAANVMQGGDIMSRYGISTGF